MRFGLFLARSPSPFSSVLCFCSHFRWFFLLLLLSLFRIWYCFFIHHFPLHAWAIRHTFINYLGIIRSISLSHSISFCCLLSIIILSYSAHPKCATLCMRRSNLIKTNLCDWIEYISLISVSVFYGHLIYLFFQLVFSFFFLFLSQLVDYFH